MADFSQWWWQAADAGPGPGPGPDAGDPIGQSLRFRGAKLTGPNVNATDWTASFWCKFAVGDGGNYIFTANGDGGVTVKGGQLSFNNGAESVRGFLSPDNGLTNSTERFRDPGAWYHIVYSSSDQLRLWVNGQPIASITGFPAVSHTGQFIIGGTPSTIAGGPASGNAVYGIYQAQWYYIDGQALEPTTFGRFNSQGVWVPVDPQGLTYGSNGFKLTFEDPSNIGKDYSGNGNDFSPEAFDLNPPWNFTQDLFTSTNDAFDVNSTEQRFDMVSFPPSNAFDGNTNTQCTTNAPNNAAIIFRPDDPMEGVTLVEMWCHPSVALADFIGGYNGGNEVSLAGTGWQTIYSGSAISLENFYLRASTSQPSVSGLRVNGNWLVSSTGEDYDLMQDSPTQNFATYNPATGKSTSYTAKTVKANLALCGAAGITATEKPAGQTIYFEVSTGYTNSTSYWGSWYNTIQMVNGQLFDIDQPNAGSPPSYIIGGGFAFDISCNVFANNADEGIPIHTTLAPDDTIGVILSDTHITITVNGVASTGVNNMPLGNAFEDGMYLYGISASTSLSVENLDINFGQRPFVNAQPADTVTLQTQNMPTPAILDGREHFQAITGPGQGANTTDPNAIIGGFSATWSASGDGFGSTPPANAFDDDTTNFCNNNAGGQTITWDTSSFNLVGELTISMRSGGDYTMSIDGVEVVSSITQNSTPDDYTVTVNNPNSIVWAPVGAAAGIYLHNFQLDGNNLRDGSILALAQQTFPNGLWWIKDRVNSNNHQLVDAVRGQVGGNWLALWCNTNRNQQDYIAPAGSSVAWCWNAPDTFTGAGGSIASTGRTNDAAGFSIVTYTGTGGAGTVAHGLSAAPEFVIYKNYSEDVVDWPVYHRGLATGSNVYLNGADAQSNSGFFPSAPDANFLNVGAANPINGVADSFIAYCWHSVPGYSAFGSYQGNGNVDGPFIYTGFSVSWVVVKRVGGTANWQIMDLARNPFNPADHWMEPNESAPEQTGNSYIKEDLLSNGFKPRGGAAQQDNLNGETYIYAAFASCPFQSPATAR